MSGLVPPAAPGIAAVMMPAYALLDRRRCGSTQSLAFVAFESPKSASSSDSVRLQLWRFKIAGGDFWLICQTAGHAVMND